ncbi:MAG TPA: 2-C-methyl-D-erythritol 4-phosphate cytidylyltransferase [Desulforhopalus sp.]|nr:2-C-methyl-D-erythritol 4-phosphate cytidylyltransferase [Desulforhopalus sp.]
MKLTAAIIVAAGFGTRMQLDRPKQFHLLGGIPILARTVRVFAAHPGINRIVVVVPEDHLPESRQMLARHGLDLKDIELIAGGRRRQDSVQAGLAALDSGVDLVLVHDGARPLVSAAVIDRCLDTARRDGAAVAAVPVNDTLKRGDDDGWVVETVSRTSLWQAQTPQAARRDLLEQAFRENGEADVTDEASLLERAAIPVRLIAGEAGNLKITRPEDLALAESLLQRRTGGLRIGHGYDAHRFSENRALVLGGVSVPYHLGLAGHSDADVLTHALCDALLGAAGKEDIGHHFPDTDQRLAGISSIILLEEVVRLMNSAGYTLTNADITIVCQAPRLAPYLEEMRNRLATACQTEPMVMNIKATTTEKMGFTGRGEGIGCHAVVLLQAV